MARKRFSEREVVGIVARQLGIRSKNFLIMPTVICPICKDPITEADIPTIEKEHERAVGLLGEDDPGQCRFVHKRCHDLKTKQDIARIAKAKRQAGETGQRARRAKRGGSSIQGRPLDGTVKSAWRKKMSGEVERR